MTVHTSRTIITSLDITTIKKVNTGTDGTDGLVKETISSTEENYRERHLLTTEEILDLSSIFKVLESLYNIPPMEPTIIRGKKKYTGVLVPHGPWV